MNTRWTLTDARAFIAFSTWTFAKTMPQWPHEYTLREHAADPLDFERFAVLIREQGELRWFGRRQRFYLDIDGWSYWTMDRHVQDTNIINRARLEDARKVNRPVR